MQHRTLNEMEAVARVTPIGADSKRALRRERLERLASLLDQHRGPLRLLSRIEYLPESERFALRGDNTPLTVAYRDPVLRAQGLASDGLGDAMEFFDLSLGEAHYLLCDCHVVGAVSSRVLAERV
ncbi:MAG: hypothetical protein JOY94_03420, partial [Methylobacteriaceae bacterium]|nr:hypothetical protein [Methylobacteriaceae bacterium]